MCLSSFFLVATLRYDGVEANYNSTLLLSRLPSLVEVGKKSYTIGALVLL